MDLVKKILLKDFPDEILLMIMENLSIHDILQLSWTCKRFYNLRRFISKTSDEVVIVLRSTNTIYEIRESIPLLKYIGVVRFWKSYTNKYGDKYSYSKCSDIVHVDGNAHKYNDILPRGPWGPRGVYGNTHKYNYLFRDTDAIGDIEIIDDNNVIESVILELGYVVFESVKINGVWDIKNWFTLDKPLIVKWATYSPIDLTIIAKTGPPDANSFTIKSNKIIFNNSTCYVMQVVNYNNKIVIDYSYDAIYALPYDGHLQFKTKPKENRKIYLNK